MEQILSKYVDKLKIKLGYACINIELSDTTITSRTLIIKTLKKYGVDEAKKLSLMNIVDLIKIIQYNFINGIYLFRITSNLFPHATNPQTIKYNYDIDYAKDLLKIAGDMAKKFHQRVTMHIGQYAQVGSPSEKIFKQTIRDLQLHAKILDMMDVDMNSVIVIHIGGAYGNKNETIDRWIKRFYQLPIEVQRRLVIENDEISYNISDVLFLCKKINRPCVFDYYHHSLNPVDDVEKLIPSILNSWSSLNLKPKFHLSETAVGKRFGSHSDYVYDIPRILYDIPKKYKLSIDIMIEAKKKEKAVKKLHQKFFTKNNKKNIIFYKPSY